MVAQTVKSQTITRAKLEAEVCRESFYEFFLRFWPSLVSEKLVENWHLKYLCEELQIVAERVFKRLPKEYDLIINLPPGSTKSTICSEMFPAWCWARDPSIRSICGSYTDRVSDELADKCYRVLTCDKYRELFPEVELEKEAIRMLKTTKGGERITTSTGGSITGMHGHFILIDDPINPKKAVSDIELKNANDWFDHTLLSRMVDRSITPVILVMQRLHQNDPSEHMLEKRETSPVREIVLPDRISDDVRPRSLRGCYVDGLFDAVRLPEAVLERTAAELGAYAYAGQYQQRPTPMGGGMFKTDMIRLETTPTLMRQVVRYWDKAGTSPSPGRKAAWTVGFKLGLDIDRNLWILDVVRGQWEAYQRERIILQTAQTDGPTVLIGVEQEPGSGGKESAQATLKNLMGFRVRVDCPRGDKILRAEPFSEKVNGGIVRMVRAPWNATVLNEFMFFPFSKYKDIVDAASGAFQMIAGPRVIGGLGALGLPPKPVGVIAGGNLAKVG